MKKILFYFSVAFVFIACNKPAESKKTEQDSAITEEVVTAPADSLKSDSIANVDSVAPVM